jgi:hypothetical protein
MKTGLKYGIFVAAFMALVVTGYSDTLLLKNGDRVSGYYEGGTTRVIRFSTSAGVEEYDLLSVAGIEFGGDIVESRPMVETRPVLDRRETVRDVAREAVDVETPSGPPVRLQSREELANRPEAATAANTAWTIPSGSSLLVRIIDSIDSETDTVGQSFTARLEEPLMVESIEVAPRGSEIRGRILEIQSAGRVRGAAELQLELSQIVVNGIPYALTTAEYSEVGEGRGEETAARVGTGAGLGALIGLIAGGGKGAAIGAGVGAGAAGAVQVMTKGERLNIPAETLLGFTLSQSLIIAAR